MDLEKQIENYVIGYKGGDRLQKRIGEILRTCELIFKEKPLDIFITLAREGSEDMFKDCWIFSSWGRSLLLPERPC